MLNHILPQGNETSEKKTSEFSSGTRPDNVQAGVDGKWVVFVSFIDIVKCLTVFISYGHVDGQCNSTSASFFASRPIVFFGLSFFVWFFFRALRTKAKEEELTYSTWRYLFSFSVLVIYVRLNIYYFLMKEYFLWASLNTKVYGD